MIVIPKVSGRTRRSSLALGTLRRHVGSWPAAGFTPPGAFRGRLAGSKWRARAPRPSRGRHISNQEVMMAQGAVKWFNGGKGYGFIAVEGGQDVFVHFSAITGGGYRSLEEGRRSSSTLPRARRAPRRKTLGSPADPSAGDGAGAKAACPLAKSETAAHSEGPLTGMSPGAVAGSWVAQRDLVRLGDAAGLDGFQSLAETLASVPQELERVGEGLCAGSAGSSPPLPRWRPRSAMTSTPRWKNRTDTDNSPAGRPAPDSCMATTTEAGMVTRDQPRDDGWTVVLRRQSARIMNGRPQGPAARRSGGRTGNVCSPA